MMLQFDCRITMTPGRRDSEQPRFALEINGRRVIDKYQSELNQNQLIMFTELIGGCGEAATSASKQLIDQLVKHGK